MATEQEKNFFAGRNSFTIQGRIMHPNLLTAKSREEGKAPNFSLMLVWEAHTNGPTLQAMNALMAEAFATLQPGANPAVLVNPIKDYNSYIRQDGKPNPDYTQGCLWINASSGAAFAPVVVDQFQAQVVNEAEVYSGRNAAVNVEFYNMNGGKDGKGRRGLGVNIKAVMLLEGGEKLAGSAPVDLNAAFANFQQAMGQVPQAAPQPAAPAYAPPAPVAPAPAYAPPAPVAPAPQQFAPQPAAPAYAPPVNPTPLPAAPAPVPAYAPPQPVAPAVDPNNPFAPPAAVNPFV